MEPIIENIVALKFPNGILEKSYGWAWKFFSMNFLKYIYFSFA